MHAMAQFEDEQLVVVSQVLTLFKQEIAVVVFFFILCYTELFWTLLLLNQVLVADINIGYEDIVNTQVIQPFMIYVK
jgi:hypothetical protein